MKFLLQIAFCFLTVFCLGQKTVYIPNYLKDLNDPNGKQFTFDKTAESANFILIWGNTVGTDPANYPDPDLQFDPVAILDTLEKIFLAFKEFDFADESPGTNLGKYKIPVVIYNTWGPNGATGYANGGDVDGIIGAFWVHPIAMHNGDVAAHELTHSLQAQSVIDARKMNGLGPVWINSGIFWESHANFMRNLLYPKDVTAWGMDVYHIETYGDWKNTYENYEILFAIMDMEGIDMVNRLWRESYSYEYPLQTYKRLAGYDQEKFNNKLFDYVKRMATFDFSYNNLGSFLRKYRTDDLKNYLPSIQATYTILKQDSLSPNHFSVPIELAPEEYAYNVIPIYPDPDSCAVIIKFKGHKETNSHTAWRYGIVAAHPDGTISRYSETFNKDSSEIGFSLLPDESKMYLVVMGAPFDSITTNPSNDTWHGYPKHFRYPYDLNISGGVPEGFQSASKFRSQIKINGHLHQNGGGWVQNSASVGPSVFVGPYAIILGNSKISGNVRIENTATVKDATISDDVKVLNNAFVNGGNYSDSVLIKGQAFAENNVMSGNAQMNMRAKVSNYDLAGTVEVGGDVIVYNNDGYCDNGVYYRMTNYYQDNLLECDGRTKDHPVNKDVNNEVEVFTAEQMALYCHCDIYPDCLEGIITKTASLKNDILVYPNPVSDVIRVDMQDNHENLGELSLNNILGTQIFHQKLSGNVFNIDVSQIPVGMYVLNISSRGKQIKSMKLLVQR